MRILHTADWHLNETLGLRDRADDIRRALRQIAGYLDEHQVDVMLVAGDVFCDRSRQEQLSTAIADIRETFVPFLQQGGTILAISGNHDSEVFFDTLRHALDLVAPGRRDPDGNDATGRLYVAALPRVLRLAGRDCQVTQFVLMPYPTPRYLRGEDPTRYASIEEKHLKIRERFLGTLQKIKEQEIDPRLPSVLVSHLHVRGAQVHSLYRITEIEDVVVDPADVPLHWAYAAYGHVHKPQAAVSGAANARYAGSIERLDVGEAGDQKSVVLGDIVRGGLAGEPALLPLMSTPIYRVEIDGDTDLAQVRAQYPDAAGALVQYTLRYDRTRHNRDTLCQAIQNIFPRWYARHLIEIGQIDGGAGGDVTGAHDLADVVGTVRNYLRMSLSGHPDQAAVLALADELLAEQEVVVQ